ncbi:hypothetical protein [Mycobacterium asiaticum]|uniref:Uncharacterized protein n=1 Tax=Mycobacterium asiaticum TaxID=1790 RepID=A0A1A3N8L6_MYCAS|nr:hypothetical protein [Mycobacterium asiaticum]OBK16717.1 hypothetical protein A5636_24325 [Mycobacterium asiaticum]
MSTKREATKRREGERRGRRTGAAGMRTPVDSPSRRGRARVRAGKSTAPARESRAPRSGPQTSPIARPVDRPARPKNASQAKARSKARKAKAPKVVRPKLSERLAVRLAQIDLRPHTLLNRVPFVVLVIGSLGVGLALTLWLSTDAAERSYQLSHARERTRMLQQQKEALERDVREAESAPALAEAARKQGMIPTRDTAHLVQAPDGNWVVVGTPKPADGVPPPPLNSKLPDEGPPPPPKPPVTPPEVAVRVLPAPGDPAQPARTGPQVLLRGPDGSSTLGGAQLPGLPALPGQAPTVLDPLHGAPGQVPTVPGQAVPPIQAVPGQAVPQVQAPPVQAVPQVQAPPPGQTTPPAQLAPQVQVAPPVQMPPPVPAPIPGAPVPGLPTAPTVPDVHGVSTAPGTGEQVVPAAPVAPTVPGIPR